MGCDQFLDIGVEGDELVIRIGVGTLAYAAENSEGFKTYDQNIADWRQVFRVSNHREFAEGVASALREEDEVGGTQLQYLLDSCCLKAVANDRGVEECPESL